MEFKDYYKIMGVPRDATEAQIKQAYRKLARKYHPDVSKLKDAESRFKDLGEAYEVLKNPEKRAAYDQLGKGPQPGEEFRPPPDWGSGFEFRGPGAASDGAAYSDFFESLFGRASEFRGSSGPARGEDHHAKVMLDLDASLQGESRTFTLRMPELGPQGHLEARERTLNVQIPKGIQQGQTIRLSGQGAPSPLTGKSGDLLLEVEFLPHRLYSVEGRDLFLTLPVAPWEAALGAVVKAPTPAGVVDLKIPPGSRSGSKLRIKGRGIPASTPGDLYVVIEIALPPATDARARSAYESFAAALPFNPRAALGV